MVSALRDGDEAALAPQPGIADLERLAQSHRCNRRGDGHAVRQAGRPATLGRRCRSTAWPRSPSPTRVRHARHATRVNVRRRRGRGRRCASPCADDGEIGSSAGNAPGYGIVGMTERATLLGGTLTAGPWPGTGLDRQRGAAPRRAPRMTIRVLVADDQEIVRTGLAHDPRRAARHRGRRRRRRTGARPSTLAQRAATRRVPARHPDARPRRHRGHPPARRPGRRRPDRRRGHHHLRPRRVRPRRTQGGRPRVPAQGRRTRAAGPGDPRGRER